MIRVAFPLACIAVALLPACSSEYRTKLAAPSGPPAAAAARSDGGSPPTAAAEARAATPVLATIGERAPDFNLIDQSGTRVRLSQFRGRPVVLEWFDPTCPAVVLAHADGTLRDLGNRCAATGVAWLAINSSPPGGAGRDLAANRLRREEWNLRYPILFDESGEVRRAFRARATPHLFVIDAEGVLVYEGAVDDPEAARAEPTWVERALADLAAERPVKYAQTRTRGCDLQPAD